MYATKTNGQSWKRRVNPENESEMIHHDNVEMLLDFM